MTLLTTKNLQRFLGNGSSVLFSFTKKTFLNSNLVVTLRDTSTTPDTITTSVLNGSGTYDYVAVVASNFLSTAITFNTAPLSTHKITVERIRPVTQSVDLTEAQDLPAESLESSNDKLVMLMQQIQDAIGRAFKFAANVSDVGVLEISDEVADRASKFLQFNSLGDLILNDLSALSASAGVDETDTDTTKNKLVSNNLMRLVENSRNNANMLINGDFRVAQRGTTFNSTTTPANNDDTYLLDRWLLLSDGNDVVDVNQGTNGAIGNYSYINLDVETVSKKFGILQIIEQKNIQDVNSNSDVVSLSFNANVTNATKISRVKAAVLAWIGSGDAPTSDVVSSWNIEGTTPTFATNWIFKNVPVNLSVTTSDSRYKVENITLNSQNTKNLAVFIWSDDVATNDTLGTHLNITNVKLEKGSVATPYVARSYSDELRLCKRTFYKLINTSGVQAFAVGTGNNTTTTSSEIPLTFPVEMRIKPDITESAPNTWKVTNSGGSNILLDNWGTSVASKQGAVLIIGVTSGLVTGHAATLETNSADQSGYIDFDSEL